MDDIAEWSACQSCYARLTTQVVSLNTVSGQPSFPWPLHFIHTDWSKKYIPDWLYKFKASFTILNAKKFEQNQV